MKIYLWIATVMSCLLVMGCASIRQRRTNADFAPEQSIWKYDQGPYPGLRYYVRDLQSNDISPDTRSSNLGEGGGVGGAIVLCAMVIPFLVGDVILSTLLDTTLLPYDLVRRKKYVSGGPIDPKNIIDELEPEQLPGHS